jgi:hypothetical protein
MKNRVCSVDTDIKDDYITKITKEITVPELKQVEKEIPDTIMDDVEMEDLKDNVEVPTVIEAIKEDDNNPLLFNVVNKDLDEKDRQKIKEEADELRYETFIQYMQDPNNSCKNFGKRNCILAKEMNVCKYNTSRRSCYKNTNLGNTIMNLRAEFKSKPIDYDIQFKTFNEDTIIEEPTKEETSTSKKRLRK